MNVRLILATTAVCSVLATSAYAGSPYYGDDSTATSAHHMTRMKPHAATKMKDAAIPADSEYRATAPDAALGAQTAAPAGGATATNFLGADGYEPVQANPQFFNHAEGTMGAP